MDRSRPRWSVSSARALLRWPGLRTVVAAGVLGALVWRLGTEPFVAGLSRVDAASLAAAGAVAVVTTVCCAWRWSLVAHSMGVGVPLRTAVAACYRSQFLNVATPGGVLGDVDRALRHGRDVGDAGRGLRSVMWERLAGQVVLLVVAGSALVVLPSPVRHPVRVAALAGLVATCAVALGVLVVRRRSPSRAAGPAAGRAAGRVAAAWRSTAGRTHAEVCAVLLDPHTRLRLVVASVVALAGHLLTFFVAARVAGAGGATSRLLPLALLVFLAMGLPSVAGWGPREGVAAWAFGAAGLGAQQGVATAVVYGVMVFVAALPGAVVVLLATWGSQRESSRQGSRRGSRSGSLPGPRSDPGAVRGTAVSRG